MPYQKVSQARTSMAFEKQGRKTRAPYLASSTIVWPIFHFIRYCVQACISCSLNSCASRVWAKLFSTMTHGAPTRIMSAVRVTPATGLFTLWLHLHTQHLSRTSKEAGLLDEDQLSLGMTQPVHLLHSEQPTSAQSTSVFVR